jgi:hypothetical protein
MTLVDTKLEPPHLQRNEAELRIMQQIAKLEPPHLQRNETELRIMQQIAASAEDHAVLMVNLNRYRPEAGYPNGKLYQEYITGLGPFLLAAGGQLIWRMPVFGQAVGEQKLDEIVFAWYPKHKTFVDLYLAPGAEENHRRRGQCVEYAVIHRCPGDCFPVHPHAGSSD